MWCFLAITEATNLEMHNDIKEYEMPRQHDASSEFKPVRLYELKTVTKYFQGGLS